ncbi:MAG: ABC transporter ATP-binding protein [Actinomycetia bacterium]|nr:ABC transporter ATP-binding protein [Actinomycetes bacterium]MCP4958078.1 ABC transporter ATP-binding protein [Actinomycetes bacterium]
MAPVLSCRGLVKRFGERTAVDQVGFEVSKGETYGLLGPNGAGKTTTISMICGLLAGDAGTVQIDGFDIASDPKAAKSALGFVPQDLALYPDLTGAENLTFFARLHGISGKRLESRVGSVLDVVGLADRRDDRTEDYSGGMKRRLNIGVGLLNEPKLLILDEPTVGVDPQSRTAILDSVEALGGTGMAVVYTTHYMEEAERLCDRLAIMDQGKMIAEGTRRELVEKVGDNDRIRLRIVGDGEGASRLLDDIDGVVFATAADGMVEVACRSAHTLLPSVVAAVGQAEARIESVELIEPDLESVFLALTGKALRD